MMKMSKLAALTAAVALLMFVALPSLSWAAEDGAALYKANCAMCHKPDATGNPAMKSPSLKGKTVDDVKKVIDTNPKHAVAKKKLTADQITAIGNYLKDLK
jgi:mono/diheme cytochrome c family protein